MMSDAKGAAGAAESSFRPFGQRLVVPRDQGPQPVSSRTEMGARDGCALSTQPEEDATMNEDHPSSFSRSADGPALAGPIDESVKGSLLTEMTINPSSLPDIPAEPFWAEEAARTATATSGDGDGASGGDGDTDAEPIEPGGEDPDGTKWEALGRWLAEDVPAASTPPTTTATNANGSGFNDKSVEEKEKALAEAKGHLRMTITALDVMEDDPRMVLKDTVSMAHADAIAETIERMRVERERKERERTDTAAPSSLPDSKGEDCVIVSETLACDDEQGIVSRPGSVAGSLASTIPYSSPRTEPSEPT